MGCFASHCQNYYWFGTRFTWFPHFCTSTGAREYLSVCQGRLLLSSNMVRNDLRRSSPAIHFSWTRSECVRVLAFVVMRNRKGISRVAIPVPGNMWVCVWADYYWAITLSYSGGHFFYVWNIDIWWLDSRTALDRFRTYPPINTPFNKDPPTLYASPPTPQ